MRVLADETLKEFERILDEQQTVSIQKLKRLLSELNMDSNTAQSNKDLRRQNKKLRQELKRYRGKQGAERVIRGIEGIDKHRGEVAKHVRRKQEIRRARG